MNLEIGYNLDTLLGSVALDYKLTLGENATGDTPMYWGDVISGEAYYYYTDANSVKSLQTCNFYFNSNISQGYNVISSEKVSVLGIRRDEISGSTPVSLAVGSTNFSISGGSVWQYGVSLNPPYAGKANSASIIVYNNDTGVGGSTPTYSELTNVTTILPNYFASTNWGGINYTTSPAIHNKNSNVPYMPISGRTMSYNDLVLYIVDEYNGQNPSETITADDLPPFDDSTEPTNDVQPFSLDYSEILGEEEMESIIAETRYILDTTPAESFDFSLLETIPEVSAPASNVVSTVGKIFNMHNNIVPPELVTIWGGLAVFAVLFWWITK